MNTKENAQCLIIGSGPAGYTAAIYTARAGLKPVLYQGIRPGGQLTITTEVENYPGYPDGVVGAEMMVDLEKQAAKMGTDIRFGLATQVDFDKQPYKVWINDEKIIETPVVIIATGANAKWLGLESEQRLHGSGVSACAVCDGFFFKGKEVAIVGAGDTAAEEALYLSKLCSKVHMLIRRDQMRASKIMQERITSTPNITVHWNTETKEILGETKVEAIRLKNTKSGEITDLAASAFFVAIGHEPNSKVFNGWLEMDANGYIKTIAGTSRTHLEGVFACGDVQDNIYRQAVTAAASGCMAALDAERYLTAKVLN